MPSLLESLESFKPLATPSINDELSFHVWYSFATVQSYARMN